MASMNAFRSEPFSMASLSGMVRHIDYKPALLGELGIFEPMPVRTREIFVDVEDQVLKLIPTSPLGTKPTSHRSANSRSALTFETTRLVEDFTIYSYEIEGRRAAGTEADLEDAQVEFQKRMAATRDDMELTHEHHRLGALQGKLLDADGTTVLYDYFAEFGVAEPAPINFALNVDTTNVRNICNAVVRDMARTSRGAFTPQTTVHALAGDDFYDALISHPSVERTYLNWAAAENLRNGGAFQSFTFADITWHNYRGTDDDAAVAVPSDRAKLFPVGARDAFKVAWAPYEGLSDTNEPGEDLYALSIPDLEREQWVKGELYSYPLFLCQRPALLREAMLA